MIPDVMPNGVFYLPPTGWLTSFYNPPYLIICICEDSFISWNQEELRLILKMIYKDHTLNTIIKSLKK